MYPVWDLYVYDYVKVTLESERKRKLILRITFFITCSMLCIPSPPRARWHPIIPFSTLHKVSCFGWLEFCLFFSTLGLNAGMSFLEVPRIILLIYKAGLQVFEPLQVLSVATPLFFWFLGHTRWRSKATPDFVFRNHCWLGGSNCSLS